jgi:methyl-accepting chemotaxis protein
MGHCCSNGNRRGQQGCGCRVNQSVTSGDSIRLLSQSVSSSPQSAAVIDSSSAQQFVGVDQVSMAMSNIERAIQQNMVGTAQLETAVHHIEELGHSLKELVVHYKI